MDLQPPEGLVAKLRGLRQLKSIADSRRGASQGAPARRSATDDVDLGLLPVLTCWPGDAAPSSRCRR